MSDYFSDYDEMLANKLGISDSETLKQAETDIVFVRLAELMQKPVQGLFDFDHLKGIHRHLFSDIYEMAGKVKTVNLAQGGSAFCYVEDLERMQQEIFNNDR
jgi:cell filamentation protein